jgi:hypothetical protein
MANRVKTGAFTESGEGNVLADDRLVKKSDGDTYGGYEVFAFGQKRKSPRPSVQNHGKDEN